MMNWRKILAMTIGQEPETDFVHPLLASVLLYVIAYLLCFTLYSISRQILPNSLKIYVLDFFKTLVFCTYPYGHGLVRNIGGHIGYCAVAVPLTLVTLYTFNEGSPSPLGIFQDFVYKKLSLAKTIARIIAQTAAGFASFQLVHWIWRLEFHADHVERMKASECASDLKVSAIVGFFVELVAVLYDTWLSKQRLFKMPVLDLALKVLNGTVLVCLGIHWTGMYMHPAMASGLSFNCKGTSAWEHIIVYWVGGFLGCYGAITLNKHVHFDLVHSAKNGVGQTKMVNGNTRTDHGKKHKLSKRKKKG